MTIIDIHINNYLRHNVILIVKIILSFSRIYFCFLISKMENMTSNNSTVNIWKSVFPSKSFIGGRSCGTEIPILLSRESDIISSRQNYNVDI